MNARRRTLAPWRQVLRRSWQQLPLLLLLFPLWMVLWGEFSWLSLLSGLIVAFLVNLVFYLPPVELNGRFNPFWAVVFFGWFLYEIFIGSCHVAWLAFRPKGVRGNSVVAAPLSATSDLVVTFVSLVVTLIPGSVVIEIDQNRSVLYLHAIDVITEAEAEGLRAKVRSIERGLVRAMGSAGDVEAIR